MPIFIVTMSIIHINQQYKHFMILSDAIEYEINLYTQISEPLSYKMGQHKG